MADDNKNSEGGKEEKPVAGESKVSLSTTGRELVLGPNGDCEKKVSMAEDGALSLDKGRKSELDAELKQKRKSAPIMATAKPPAKIFILILALVLVITGSINTIAAKWASQIKIDDRKFNHPFFQAVVMFVGEMCCMVAYLITLLIQRYRWKKRHANDERLANRVFDLDSNMKRASEISECSKCESVMTDQSGFDVRSCDTCVSQIPTIPRFNWFLFAAPALCDVVATSVQYVALVLTNASSYQMLRGAVIIFTGLLSMIFLRMRLEAFRWVGMIVVVVGLAIVGVSDVFFSKREPSTSDTSTTTDIIVGDALVVVAQVVVAIQMVVEQKLLAGCDVPALFAVGLEGIFGFVILSIAMIPMYYIHVPSMFSDSPENRLEDALDAFYEMSQSGELVGALSLTVVSIAFFNFSGISVTKYMSATTRMVLDSIRTIIIWALSIPLFNEEFIKEKILGFVFLVLGMFVYNDILFMPYIRTTKLYARIFPKSAARANEGEVS